MKLDRGSTLFKVSPTLRYRVFLHSDDRYWPERLVLSSKKRWCATKLIPSRDYFTACTVAFEDASEQFEKIERIRKLLRQEVATHRRKSARSKKKDPA